MSTGNAPTGSPWFVPLLLIVLALLIQTLSTTLELARVRESLATQHAAQEVTLGNAQKLRSQLESIAGETAVLAELGNENAIRLKSYLEQQGVKLNAPPRQP